MTTGVCHFGASGGDDGGDDGGGDDGGDGDDGIEVVVRRVRMGT